MKTIYSILALCAILLISSCYDCRRKKEKTGEEKVDERAVKVDSPIMNPVELSPNKLVVRFPDDMSEDDKEALRDSVYATVDSTCSCGTSPIELWEIDTTKIDIEHAKRQTVNNDDSEMEGDHQFYFSVPDSGSVAPSIAINADLDPIENGIQNVLSIYTATSHNSDSRMNIAIVDTGFDFKDHEQLQTNFLYDTSNIDMDCNQEYKHLSGWNFVDGNADITDSHSDGHGTFVTKTLMRELEASDIPYSILPIKAFDGSGRGSYWDIVCAFNYIKEIQAVKGDLKIVNASFGYGIPVVDEASYQESVAAYNERSILASLITELGNNGTLIVASAGNDHLNTDEIGKAHFPSGFTAPNLIGVGGYTLHRTVTTNVSRRINGNFGPISIDLAAPYQHGFPEESQNSSTQDILIKEGTSYGVPFTAAKIAQFISNSTQGVTPIQIKNTFLNSLETHQNFTEMVGGGRYIDTDNPIINDLRPTKIGGGTVDGGVNQTEDQ